MYRRIAQAAGALGAPGFLVPLFALSLGYGSDCLQTGHIGPLQHMPKGNYAKNMRHTLQKRSRYVVQYV